METTAVKTFPFHSLPRCGAADLMFYRRFARSTPAFSVDQEGLTKLKKWFGDILLGASSIERQRIRESHPSTGPLSFIMLRHPTMEPGLFVGLELEMGLSAFLLDKLFGARGSREEASALRIREVEKGVLAYLANVLLRGSGWRVVGVLSTREAVIEAMGENMMTVWTQDIRVDYRPFQIRLWCPDEIESRTVCRPRRRRANFSFDGLWAATLKCTLDVASAKFLFRELSEIAVDDIVFFDNLEVDLHGHGTATLKPMRSTRLRLIGQITDGGFSVQDVKQSPGELLQEAHIAQNEIDSMNADSMNEESNYSAEPKTDLSDDGLTEEVLTRVGDAEVEVFVEIARLRMSIESLTKIAPGEVVATPAMLGQNVALRSGEQVIAKGRLVDVDGRVGIQVLELG